MNDKESLSLKWGTLKAWKLNPEGPAFAALKKYIDAGNVEISAMLQKDNEVQKAAICEIIDVIEASQIYLDWDGKYVSKEQAKHYVLNYGKD